MCHYSVHTQIILKMCHYSVHTHGSCKQKTGLQLCWVLHTLPDPYAHYVENMCDHSTLAHHKCLVKRLDSISTEFYTLFLLHIQVMLKICTITVSPNMAFVDRKDWIVSMPSFIYYTLPRTVPDVYEAHEIKNLKSSSVMSHMFSKQEDLMSFEPKSDSFSCFTLF